MTNLPVIVCEKAPTSTSWSLLPLSGGSCPWCGRPLKDHEQTAWAMTSEAKSDESGLTDGA